MHTDEQRVEKALCCVQEWIKELQTMIVLTANLRHPVKQYSGDFFKGEVRKLKSCNAASVLKLLNE